MAPEMKMANLEYSTSTVRPEESQGIGNKGSNSWVVQKYGGTSLGKFSKTIAEIIM
jgi:hypothetical protein